MVTPLHIVLVEDNPADVVFFREALRAVPYRRMVITHVETLEAARLALAAEKFDAAVLDLGLPDSDGLETYLAFQQCAPGLPVVVLTGLADDKVAEQALQQGAQDYLQKGEFTGEILGRSIRYAIKRKAAEEALRESEARYRQLHQELEARVEARTQELRAKQAQLVQAAKLASVGELAAGMAHELNNPLNNIMLLIGNAMDRVRLGTEGPHLPRVLLESLEKAQGQVHRAAAIITHLRTFARQETLARDLVSVHAIIERSVEFVREQLRLAGIALELALAPDRMQVVGSQVQLEQVVLNLLINARDAVREAPEKRIRIATEVRGKWIAIQVQDTGSGIPSDILPRIFDPFFTTKEVGEGTGLGLSIAYGIVKEHGGRIETHSAPGGGTTFFIRLPLATV